MSTIIPRPTAPFFSQQKEQKTNFFHSVFILLGCVSLWCVSNSLMKKCCLKSSSRKCISISILFCVGTLVHETRHFVLEYYVYE